MATWDGSYSGPDDQNYYVYSDHNVPGPAPGNWTLLPNNINNDFLQSNHQFYVQNEPAVEQSTQNAFFQSNPTIVPNLISGTGNYHEHLTEPLDKTQVPNNRECFPNNVKSQQFYVSDKCWNHNYNLKKAKTKRNLPKKDITEATHSTINQSKLQVTAADFVPSHMEANDEKHELPNVEPVSISNSYIEDHSRSLDKYFFSNANRQERKYNNKRNSNHKSKEDQRDSFYKGNMYTKSYQHQGKNSYRFQGNNTDNSLPYNNKNGSINLSNGESSLNKDVNSFKSKFSSGKDNAEETDIIDAVKDNGIQNCDNQVKECYNSHVRQSYSNYRNVKRYPNIRSDRDENSYKEKRRNYHGYNRENYNKEIKSKVKDYGKNNGQTNEFKESFGEETSLEAKERKEKNIKYHGYDGFKDNNRESKTESCLEKDKNKYYKFENKEKGYEYWRNRRESNKRTIVQKWAQNKKSILDDDANQRERLIDQLNRGQLECLVCCEYVKQSDYVWSCSNCYHVLHLKCTKKWAKSSQAENGWRCPACQNVSLIIPEDYVCFCGKTIDPEWNRREVAHSCGEICGRTLSRNTCPHKCTLLCHPGSCPQCTAMVTKHCGCGKTSQTVQCSTHKLLFCDSICGKDLNCGSHKCEKKCHHGECSTCEKTVTQTCYCGKHTREVTCETGISIVYSCEEICGKLLECGNHTCKKLCHEDACESCSLVPEKITTCCCGQTKLTETRQTCLDPVPTCDKICSKNLKCGQPDNPHKCKAKCHQGDCPVCDLTTDVKCRCGNMDREIACKDLTSKADDARCEKRCTKKRFCGKHKCNQFCCVEIDHICPLICSKTLSCGRHKCEQSCHKGRCQSCWRSSFDELYCECGASVIYPPVPCGTRRPTCDKPCSRQHS